MEKWQVVYPEGLIKYIDHFRKKYLQYETFDKVLHEFLDKHLSTSGRDFCSLGSGTGRHEVELFKRGYNIMGLERNTESLQIAQQYARENDSSIDFIECDFLIQEQIEQKLGKGKLFDVVGLLYIPISKSDIVDAINYMSKYLKPGGVFITAFFGYKDYFTTEKLKTASEVEVVDIPNDKDFAVRLNYYEYDNTTIHWDAIYLFHDENGNLKMERDHDILEVIPQVENKDPLNVNSEIFELLPTYRITETHDGTNPPHTYHYLIGWKKK